MTIPTESIGPATAQRIAELRKLHDLMETHKKLLRGKPMPPDKQQTSLRLIEECEDAITGALPGLLNQLESARNPASFAATMPVGTKVKVPQFGGPVEATTVAPPQVLIEFPNTGIQRTWDLSNLTLSTPPAAPSTSSPEETEAQASADHEARIHAAQGKDGIVEIIKAALESESHNWTYPALKKRLDNIRRIINTPSSPEPSAPAPQETAQRWHVAVCGVNGELVTHNPFAPSPPSPDKVAEQTDQKPNINEALRIALSKQNLKVAELEAKVKELEGEREVFKEMIAKKYDVMAWACDDGGLTLMKQDGAMVNFKVGTKDGIPSGPSESSRWIPDQRCLLVPAKHLAALERQRDELVGACKALCNRMEVNELIGKTDRLGLRDQRAYDLAQAALSRVESPAGRDGTKIQEA